MAYELMKAWVESDTEHPVPGEIVSFVVVYAARRAAQQQR